jgi:ATP-dependent Lhr-like helicase
LISAKNGEITALTVLEKQNNKFDEYLPEDILSIGYGAKAFDINRTKAWLLNFL